LSPSTTPSTTGSYTPSLLAALPISLGTYGTFAINAAGAWTYTASSAHNEFAAGTTYTDTFSVASADGTLTSVTINIAGTNDAAVHRNGARLISNPHPAADTAACDTT